VRGGSRDPYERKKKKSKEIVGREFALSQNNILAGGRKESSTKSEIAKFEIDEGNGGCLSAVLGKERGGKTGRILGSWVKARLTWQGGGVETDGQEAIPRNKNRGQTFFVRGSLGKQ